MPQEGMKGGTRGEKVRVHSMYTCQIQLLDCALAESIECAKREMKSAQHVILRNHVKTVMRHMPILASIPSPVCLFALLLPKLLALPHPPPFVLPT